jgi:hypothetical protein
MTLPSLCLNAFGATFLGGTDASTDTRIVFILAYVTFTGLSHITYHHETREMDTAVRVRIKGANILFPTYSRPMYKTFFRVPSLS